MRELLNTDIMELIKKIPIWGVSFGFDKRMITVKTKNGLRLWFSFFDYHHCWYDTQLHSIHLLGFYILWEGYPFLDK